MTEDFTEHDLDTPSEQDLDQAYGSKFLSSTDIGDHKIRTKIAKVRKEELRDGDGDRKKVKFILYFTTIDKPLILNATNKDALVDRLGRKPADWIGAEVGVFVDSNVIFAGKRTKGIRLRVLAPPSSKPKQAAAPAASKPSDPQTAAATPWPEQAGDPGPQFNDDIPDFETAI